MQTRVPCRRAAPEARVGASAALCAGAAVWGALRWPAAAVAAAAGCSAGGAAANPQHVPPRTGGPAALQFPASVAVFAGLCAEL